MQAFALLALAASVAAQAVTSSIAPSSPAPAGCQASYSGDFEITTVQPASKRDLESRQATTCGQTGILTINLSNGKLMDNLGRTGYIASNTQFQFDMPPQAGAIYTAGFSVCGNGSLAIGGTTIFYQCQSGSFYNLYSASQGAQCQQVNIDIVPCSGSTAASSASAATVAAASVSTDGQPEATASATKAVSEYTDGQPQATAPASKAPVASEFTDGQPQVTANATVKATPTNTIVPAAGAMFTAPAALIIAGAMAAALL